jgi:hypothetical protein
MPARELAGAIRHRFSQADDALEADLIAAEESEHEESLDPRTALGIVQRLHAHRQKLTAAAHTGGERSTHLHANERAS